MENNGSNPLYDLFSAAPLRHEPPVTPTLDNEIYTLNFAILPSSETVQPDIEEVSSLHEEARAIEPAAQEITIPGDLLSLASQAITRVLATNQKPRITSRELAHTAYPRSVGETAERFELFKAALKLDDRLKYLGAKEFEVVERTDIKTSEDWLKSWQVDIHEMESAKEEVIGYFSAVHPERPFSEEDINTVLKKRGFYLLEEEEVALLSLIVSDFRIQKFKSGLLKLRLDPESIPTRTIESRSLSQRAISQAMKQINRTSAVQNARDLEKNLADNRKRKKKSRSGTRSSKRMGGRGQGKKITFEQLVSHMNVSEETKSPEDGGDLL